jgi:hypothetical protein
VPRCGALSILQKPLHYKGGWVGRGAQAIAFSGARCASQVLDRGAQAVARGAARCMSQVLDSGAQADARDAMYFLNRGVQAFSRGATPLCVECTSTQVSTQLACACDS